VRAENRIHGSDQQSCSAGAPAVMITNHVPAVRVPRDHATCGVAAAVSARAGVADRRDLDPAPPAHGPAAAAAAADTCSYLAWMTILDPGAPPDRLQLPAGQNVGSWAQYAN
jgi:hypothetical protein